MPRPTRMSNGSGAGEVEEEPAGRTRRTPSRGHESDESGDVKKPAGGRSKRQAADASNSPEETGRSSRTRRGKVESDESFEANADKEEDEDEEEDDEMKDAVEEDELASGEEEEEEEDEEEEQVMHRKSQRSHVPASESLPGKSTKSGGASTAPGGSPSYEWVANAKIVLEKVLAKQDCEEIFGEPVDPKALKLIDYFKIVKVPMDLGTVKKNLASRGYRQAEAFAEDVRLTFDNAMLYNGKKDAVHKLAEKLKDYFQQQWDVVSGDLDDDNKGGRRGRRAVQEDESDGSDQSGYKDVKREYKLRENRSKTQPYANEVLAKHEAAQLAREHRAAKQASSVGDYVRNTMARGFGGAGRGRGTPMVKGKARKSTVVSEQGKRFRVVETD
ncbi:Bromodomain-containing protein, partial [Baffinella frigidus]